MMAKPVAAGVIVLDGARILAFERSDKPGLSLPCGHVEAGETFAAAAVREAEEETGLALELANTAPFVGFDTVGNKLVHTFLARVTGGVLHDAAHAEGRPRWASIRDVAHGPYWHYNRRAFRHFGIRIPLVGAFRSCLTLATSSRDTAVVAAQLVDGTLTALTETTFSITHHDRTGQGGVDDHRDIAALLELRAQRVRASGIEITRRELFFRATDRFTNPQDADLACSEGLFTDVRITSSHADAFATLGACPSTQGWHLYAGVALRRFSGPVRLVDIDACVDALVTQVLPHAEIDTITYEVALDLDS